LINISKDDEVYLDKIAFVISDLENKILDLEDESLFYKEYDNYHAILFMKLWNYQRERKQGLSL